MGHKFTFKSNRFVGNSDAVVEAPDLATAIRYAQQDVIGKMVVYHRDFSGMDLSGLDLSGITFEGCSFDGTDLTGADLTDARIEGPLNGTKLRNAILLGTRFKTTARNIDLTGAMLDMSCWQGSTIDGVDVSDVKWRVEDMPAWRRAKFDDGVILPGARKYETKGAVAIEGDPFKGVWMTGIKGLDEERLPPYHATIRKASRRVTALGFVGDMLNNKVAWAAGVGGVGFLSSTLASKAGAEFPDIVGKIQSAADGVGKLSDRLLNSVTPWTPESMGTVERLVDAGLSQNAAVGAIGVGLVAVLAGGAVWKRMELSEKLATYVKAKAVALMDRLGISGEWAAYVGHRARLLWSKDKQQLSWFRDLVGKCSGDTHRMLSEAGGYFFVCDRNDFSRALAMMQDNARDYRPEEKWRPVTFWFESHENDGRIPTTMTFRPTMHGVEVAAVWTDKWGEFSRANLYDGRGVLVETVNAKGDVTKFDDWEPIRNLVTDLYSGMGTWLEDVRSNTSIPPSIRKLFHYDAQTHSLGRAHDGTWMLRDRETGNLDNGFGDTAVFGYREDGRSTVELSYSNGELREDRSIDFSTVLDHAAGAQGSNP